MKLALTDPGLGITLNCSGMQIDAAALEGMRGKFAAAAEAMTALEAGAVKNPDENRKVTHFTDRIGYPESALFREVEEFAAALRSGSVTGPAGRPFDAVVVNGIGGSALGPQLLQFALNGPYWNEMSRTERKGGLKIYFLDNTDSAGLHDLLPRLDLAATLQLCVSKSGGTQETTNNLTVLEKVYAARGVDFSACACAITMAGSKLDKHAKAANWRKVFPMAESIGGRTSETSIVGHVPAALTGLDFAAFLKGACAMDVWTRKTEDNPAYLLAATWYLAGNGRGDRNMVIVPYSDRLVLLSRYLQQLVMESLGKELDLDGRTVHQGLNVFGNKGGTDAHAFIQQLNDGRDDFFAMFIEVLEDAEVLEVADGVTMGDYLHGFLYGLAAALTRKGRKVMTLSLPRLCPETLGALIALYERAVAVYAEFIHVNAFHQPGVQAYKLAAKGTLALRQTLFAALERPCSGTAAELAERAGVDDPVVAAGWLERAALNPAEYRAGRVFDAVRGEWVYTLEK